MRQRRRCWQTDTTVGHRASKRQCDAGFCHGPAAAAGRDGDGDAGSAVLRLPTCQFSSRPAAVSIISRRTTTTLQLTPPPPAAAAALLPGSTTIVV